MPQIRRESERAERRGMGNFAPIIGTAPVHEKPRSGRSLTNLVRDERCEDCSWPDVCAKDRTCWEEEAALNEQTHAERRELQRTLGRIIDEGVEIRVRHELGEEQQRLLARLGATYVIDENAERCAGPCGWIECAAGEPKEETMQDEDGRQALEEMETGTVRCKVEGCENTTTVTHGRYAKLCDEHRLTAASGGGSASTETAPRRESTTNGSGWASRARDLIPLARRLDRAEAKLLALPQTTSTKTELEEAMRRVQGAPTPENLERLAQATKAMQKGKDPRKRAEDEVEAAELAFKQELAALARKAAS